jgi:plasmid stabilization system protein ParE
MARAKRIIWAPSAKQDLREIRRYYARIASPEVADSILREIDRAGQRIASNPLAWRARDALIPGLRSALARPYTLYRIRRNDIEIVRVLHERRDFPALFSKDDR